MANYESANNNVISKAFSRLKANEEEIVKKGMYGLLEAGLEYLNDAHEVWMHHENEADTLGWALIHDGEILEIVSQVKGEPTPYGNAIGRLQEIASGVTDGWVGIILSDMTNDWYRVDWEMGFLFQSADEVRNHFSEFFKPIS